MNRKLMIKMTIDIIMTIFLILLMAYQIVGEEMHEWVGSGMGTLFLAHNILNFNWYKNLFKGKYTIVRAFRTFVNIALLVVMVAVGWSGIVLSKYTFAFLPIETGMALARIVHLSGSYWAFVLMSVHLGVHWGMIMGMFRKMFRKKSKFRTYFVRILGIIIALVGAYLFIARNIPAYLFLQVEFAFLDYEKSMFEVFGEYVLMMGLWVFIAHYLLKLITMISVKHKRKSRVAR